MNALDSLSASSRQPVLPWSLHRLKSPVTCPSRRLLPWNHLSLAKITIQSPRVRQTSTSGTEKLHKRPSHIKKPSKSSWKSAPSWRSAPFRAQHSRRFRKRWRQSRPLDVLDSIRSAAKGLYVGVIPGKNDLSHSKRVSLSHSNLRRLPQTDSLYSILARFLDHHTTSEPAHEDFQFSTRELDILHSQGHSPASVESWASCLVGPRVNDAAKIFEPGRELPPLFLIALFLRRKHLRKLALDTVMIHLNHRMQSRHICWSALKVLVVRLLRHAREIRPDSIPRIASLFVTEASRLHLPDSKISRTMLADLTKFSNVVLLLISLPGNIHPLLFTSYQEQAQVQVLEYMASTSPAILVNRIGFRSITRNQLAHAKTEQERQWALLKSPSWPPWKGNRTAMDEDIGYDYGTSRASKVLHRMYEAGYTKRTWEDMADIYAGWDTDYSPTIQTRTSLPNFSTQYRDVKLLRPLIWAGRIRATRTRREAWAGFLACEAKEKHAPVEAYLAMFEKLYYPEMKRTVVRESSLESHRHLEQPKANLLPGDMKEVAPDLDSPLHYVFLSEPVPNYKQLYRRMRSTLGRPSGRLLAFLLETCHEFPMALEILGTSEGPVADLFAGKHRRGSAVHTMPGYLLGAFIRFLCRFGRFDNPTYNPSRFVPSDEHAMLLQSDRQYLLEYAHTLLMHYRPKYLPAWATLATYLVQYRGGKPKHILRYNILRQLFDAMERADIDIDDELFQLFCTGTYYAAQAAWMPMTWREDGQFIIFTGWTRLRVYFQTLVGASAEAKFSNPVEESDRTVFTHIPGPAVLHAYVRALGMLRDWEGLYSFSTWLAKHHAEVTARAELRHTTKKLFFITLVALRAAVDKGLEAPPYQGASGSAGVAQLIRTQIESVEEWGGWPSKEHVDLYNKGQLRSDMPTVDGQ